ncbi:cytochrome P450 [Pholiota conissans]|uniref:Cytochrome P450 n=1 Tax=Pholiota conissans TaxID=109636 RepID=A0A9P5ZBE8_9AGAR|nr:cytochrome P450 [Pholiota conissans]
MALQQLLFSLLATGGAYAFYRVTKFFYAQWTSPLHALPGPPNPSLIYGNMKLIWEAENSVLHEKWVEEYGPTITYNVLFGAKRLYTLDSKALNHVLMNNYIYQKPESARYALSRILGNGVLIVEGDKHKQQRRIMNPAFGASQIRELTEIFVEKSVQLRDIWMAESTKEGGTGRVEILGWLSKMTLDVIGLAGFNYNFDALAGKTNELNDAFSVVFRSGTRMTLLAMLRGVFPPLRFIPDERDADRNRAVQNMDRIGAELLRDSKAAVMNDKASWTRRDLLSLLLRANLATDLPPTQRMSDSDVLAQVPTFLVAGHETTSTATTWALYALTQNKEAQIKLREELLTVGTDNPTMDELNALPYLDAVVRETLRVHAPVPATSRVAVQDDILPLGTPFMDKNGKMVDSIKVVKGQTILIPLLALNRAKYIWGEDSLEFRPERWEKVPEGASTIPGVWGNMMTFLGGPRACIGYRFSLVEMKALLFTLVRAFEFELAVPAEDIIKKSFIVQRPLLKSDPKGGNQMPLILKPVARA